MSRIDSPRAVEREDLLVEPLEAALALAHDLRLKAAVAIPRRVDPHRPVLGRSASSASCRCACSRRRRAAPGAARSRDGRSARPPSPAPPAAWSARPAARRARRSPPRVRAPASSSSITSSESRSRTPGASSSTAADPASGASRGRAARARRARRRASPATLFRSSGGPRGSRGGCPPRLPQNRTYAVRIRLFGTAGYDPRRRPVCDLEVIPISASCGGSGATIVPGVALRCRSTRKISPRLAKYALRRP